MVSSQSTAGERHTEKDRVKVEECRQNRRKKDNMIGRKRKDMTDCMVIRESVEGQRHRTQQGGPPNMQHVHVMDNGGRRGRMCQDRRRTRAREGPEDPQVDRRTNKGEDEEEHGTAKRGRRKDELSEGRKVTEAKEEEGRPSEPHREGIRWRPAEETSHGGHARAKMIRGGQMEGETCRTATGRRRQVSRASQNWADGGMSEGKNKWKGCRGEEVGKWWGEGA